MTKREKSEACRRGGQCRNPRKGFGTAEVLEKALATRRKNWMARQGASHE